MAHAHAEGAGHNRSVLIKVILLTGGFMLVEAVAAIWTNSLALLADAGHMLADVTGLLLAFFAAWLMTRHVPLRRSYGWHRSEALAAFGTSMLMHGMALFIIFEAWQRIHSPPEIRTVPMLAIAAIGLGVNLVGMRLLHGKGALYMRAAAFEVLADALGSVAVIVSGLIMLFTGFLAADAIISALIGLAIIPRVWHLLKETIDILLEAVPAHINPLAVRRALLNFKGVREVHDLHIWQIATGFTALTCHLVGKANLAAVREMLHEKFDIWHSTVQMEKKPLHEHYIGQRWRYRKGRR